MIRVFGLIVALAALMAPAQAALLTYSFTNSAVGTVDPAFAGSADPFTGGGSVGASSWTTASLNGTPNTNTFSFTATTPGVSLENVVLSARRNGSGSSNNANITVYFNVGATSTGTLGEEFISSSLGTSFNNINGDLGFNLLGGQTIHFTVVSSRTSSGAPTASFDFIDLNGSPIPEPTSMAVFGLLGAGIAARRIRRKA